jgi:hypothetical protein
VRIAIEEAFATSPHAGSFHKKEFALPGFKFVAGSLIAMYEILSQVGGVTLLARYIPLRVKVPIAEEISKSRQNPHHACHVVEIRPSSVNSLS